MPQLFATKLLLSSLNDGRCWNKKKEGEEEEELANLAERLDKASTAYSRVIFFS